MLPYDGWPLNIHWKKRILKTVKNSTKLEQKFQNCAWKNWQEQEMSTQQVNVKNIQKKMWQYKQTGAKQMT